MYFCLLLCDESSAALTAVSELNEMQRGSFILLSVAAFCSLALPKRMSIVFQNSLLSL